MQNRHNNPEKRLKRGTDLAVILIRACILYAVITLVRQIAEPKIVGQSLGIHPILTLVAMYGGLRLAGVWGMMLFPLVLVIVKGMINTDRVVETQK
jgi:predicted PurR-regulated permease PerM